MNKKCPQCKFVNFNNSSICKRCKADISQVVESREKENSAFKKLTKRFIVLIFALVFTIGGFYLTLIFSAEKLSFEEKQTTREAIDLLLQKGFNDEFFTLNYLTAFRRTDNWLNASVEKENAYAATNYPFAIMTLYNEFFTVPLDTTERAAILLHEAHHVSGGDEYEAYKFTWQNRKKLGWTKEKYAHSIIWLNVRKQTKYYAPELFNCPEKEYFDCTE